MSDRVKRIAVLQRICASYRVDLFSALGKVENVDFKLFIGRDIPGTKVKGVSGSPGVNAKELETKFVKLGRKIFPIHLGLVRELKKFRPTVVLCEGESHFLGYLQAIYYQLRYDRRVRLIHWCFIALPGDVRGRLRPAEIVKRYFRKYFSAFLVYSSFSKDRLVGLGQDPRQVFTATNVGNVGRAIEQSDAIKETKKEIRAELGLPDRFTVLYVGTLSRNKRPDLVLDLASRCRPDQYSFLVLGEGDLLDALRSRVDQERLAHVCVTGKITDQLPKYYRASDVLLIPGRGGIVMSEAMAFGVAVVVHQADGTEFDLVHNGVTGVIVRGGHVDAYLEALEDLQKDPVHCEEMGLAGRDLIENRWNTANMVSQIVRAAEYAQKVKN